MPCLNDKLPINYSELRKIFVEELDEIIKDNLYYIDGENEKKEKFKNKIIDEFKNRINTNIIIERVIHPMNCIHKYKKGKKESYYCCKNITDKGNKNKFVCCVFFLNQLSS